ncbi:uncharacterized protein LOC114367972 [Glycine soja]|nr:uncharacterized protein LOC114367972 [Glycine soja]
MEAQPTPPPDPVDSSPHSWDEPCPSLSSAKLRLMCSYGGHIVPRPHDKSLCYVGGDTRIVVVPRHVTLSELSTRLSKSFLHARPFVLKYQLPSEDLDSLVSVTTDEDLENMIDEYDHRSGNNNNNKPSSRIRLFLFPSQPDSVHGPAGLGSVKSEEWLSGSLDGGLSESASVNCILGLDDEVASASAAANSNGNSGKVFKDVVSDSPMLESNSSFGSGSSVPPNLPPIKVHVEIEEQFAQLGVGQKQQEDEGFVAPVPVMEFSTNRLVSDDERSDHGVPLGHRKSPTPPLQPQPHQFQQKSPHGVVDLPSPDSLSSDSSLSNAMLRPKPAIYQDQVQIQYGSSQVPSNASVDPKLNVTDQQGWIQMQQHVQEAGYVLQPQFDQLPLPQQHQTQPPQQQHQPQQYIHNTHLIHHTLSGSVPIPASYYPVCQQQLHTQHLHHLDQQYPVYYVQARQAQPYNLSVQLANAAESATTMPSSQSQNQPSSAAYNSTRNPNFEMAAGACRTAPATRQLVQVSSSKHQQQYVAHSQIYHHHPQSMPPKSAVPANYAYNYADPALAQVFYSQPLAPFMPSHYQTMTAASVMRTEVSAKLPSDSMKKPQQVTTSQPL